MQIAVLAAARLLHWASAYAVVGHVNFVEMSTGLGMTLTCEASTAFMPSNCTNAS